MKAEDSGGEEAKTKTKTTKFEVPFLPEGDDMTLSIYDNKTTQQVADLIAIANKDRKNKIHHVGRISIPLERVGEGELKEHIQGEEKPTSRP